MPKTKIDYSSTLFYMIFCKDTNIKDLYIGHTTNFVQRKHAHKQSCTNTKSTNYPCKLYTVIRDNGGWDNWKMQIIAFHECDDFMAAKKYEQQYFEDYDATLNSVDPMPQPKPKIITEVVKETLNSEMDEETLPKYINKFECDKCNFKCHNYKDYKRHLTTRKHINRTTLNKIENKTLQKNPHIFKCECGKEYLARNSLWYHKQNCTIFQSEHNNELEVEQPINDNLFTQKMIETVLLQNKEVMNIFMDKLTLNQNNFMEKLLEKLT